MLLLRGGDGVSEIIVFITLRDGLFFQISPGPFLSYLEVIWSSPYSVFLFREVRITNALLIDRAKIVYISPFVYL